jgi:hypothetical protein
MNPTKRLGSASPDFSLDLSSNLRQTVIQLLLLYRVLYIRKEQQVTRKIARYARNSSIRNYRIHDDYRGLIQSLGAILTFNLQTQAQQQIRPPDLKSSNDNKLMGVSLDLFKDHTIVAGAPGDNGNDGKPN